MNIDVNATYRDGVLVPQTPLDLPDNTPVRLVVAPRVSPTPSAPPGPGRRPPPLPASPRFTASQLRASLEKHSFAVGALPADFSRADIYSDHD